LPAAGVGTVSVHELGKSEVRLCHAALGCAPLGM